MKIGELPLLVLEKSVIEEARIKKIAYRKRAEGVTDLQSNGARDWGKSRL